MAQLEMIEKMPAEAFKTLTAEDLDRIIEGLSLKEDAIRDVLAEKVKEAQELREKEQIKFNTKSSDAETLEKLEVFNQNLCLEHFPFLRKIKPNHEVTELQKDGSYTEVSGLYFEYRLGDKWFWACIASNASMKNLHENLRLHPDRRDEIFEALKHLL